MDGYCLRISLFTVVFVSHLYHMFVNTRHWNDVFPIVETNVNIASSVSASTTCAWVVRATCACSSRRWLRCTTAPIAHMPLLAAALTPCWDTVPRSSRFFLQEHNGLARIFIVRKKKE